MSAGPRSPARRFLAPEVIQTSAMDCGPAALKCLLGGFGIEASYGRLREACQTDVDGTSIDTLEAIGQALGLEVTQTMAPIDWLLRPEAESLPCLVVVKVPGGGTHFLVAWRRLGPFVQLMDPASGRRWVRCSDFEKELYRHSQPLPAAALRRWLGSDVPRAVLAARLAALGVAGDGAEALLVAAAADPGCGGFARLDAALRLAELLRAGQALAAGEATRTLLAALIADPARIPARLFAFEEVAGESGGALAGPDGEPQGPKKAARDSEADPRDGDRPTADARGEIRDRSDAEPGESLGASDPGNGEEPVAAVEEPVARLHGAVFLKVAGRRSEGAAADLPPDLEAALAEPPARPGRLLWELVRQGGAAPLAIAAAAALGAAAGSVALGLALRALVDLRAELPLAGQRLFALGAIAALAAGLLLIEAPAVAALLQVARGLELRLRLRFAAKVPRLADRYLRSRPRSDMAQRAHALHRVRQLPGLASRLLRAGLGLVACAAGLTWLDPGSALPAFLALLTALFLPLLALPSLCEQDFKLKSHAGALTRFNLDALLGHGALQAHGAQGAVARAYRLLLGEWATAAGRFEAASIRVEVALLLLLHAFAVWLMLAHLGRGSFGSLSLLLAFWALLLPAHALDFARSLWQVPSLRTITLRLLEPLGALEEAPAPADPAAGEGAAAGGFAFAEVTVRAGGHTVLDAIDLEVEGGEHVAVVGPSGAGKSSLLGLLLGWHRPAAGRVFWEGAPLDGQRLGELRAATAWIDPEVQLFSRSLLDNLIYGAGEGALAGVGRALQDAELEPVIEKLDQGLATPLGEGGARFSGGEGQRVRLGRALLRRDARLVLLDEPFRGLTRDSRERLLARLRGVYAKATMLFVSHDVRQALTFPRVIVVENGRIAEDGAPADLLARPDSRLAALVASEENLRRRLGEDPSWRRLHLDNGRLAAAPAPPPAGAS